MRLLRVALANWRGVHEREVRFANGITLIAGPNEIGKSTIVECNPNLATPDRIPTTKPTLQREERPKTGKSGRR